MASLLILLIIIGLVIAVVILLRRRPAGEASESRRSPSSSSGGAEPTVQELGPGGVVTVRGTDYVVEAKHRYQDPDGYRWFELKLVDGENNVQWLEWEVDEGLELSLWEKIDFERLGLSAADLERFDDDEAGEFTFEGVTYRYDESDEARFFEGDGEEPKPLYYWDFEERGGDRLSSVERWGRRFEAAVGGNVPEFDIQVLRAGPA